MASIELRDIRKSFGGVNVIKGVNLSIEQGEFMVFVGPSGCGKSTLLRMISGLDDISSGDLLFGGKSVVMLGPSERGIAMVFQSYALYPHMTVFENMAFGLTLQKGLSKAEIRRRVDRAADMLQLGPYLDRHPKQLSGGQRQRVAIGRAITRDPKVFLFDEPLSNLDAALRVATRIEIARLHAAMPETTMIYVTHDQVEAMTLADRICVLRDGLIEQVGRPMDLYKRPDSLFVAGFIGSPKMNFITGPLAAAYGCTTLGIRGEHVKVVADGPWKGTAIHYEVLGADTYVYLEMGMAEPVVVRLEGEAGVRNGDTVSVAPVADQIHRFDAAGKPIR